MPRSDASRPTTDRPRFPSPLAWGLAGLALAAAIPIARTASRVRRELRDHRERERRLRSEWTVVPSPAGLASLAIHVRAADDMSTVLPPIVLVHGYGVGSGYLVPLAARLAEDAHVYVPELPAHGASDHDHRPLTIPELADTLSAWMVAWGLRDAVVVGHSLGCQVAAELAARRPQLVAGMVLVGPTSDAAARDSARQTLRILRSSLFERPTYTVWTSRDYRRAGAKVLAAEMREMVSHQIEDALSRVSKPVRVVRGGRDALVSQRWAETVAEVARAPAPVVLEGWGHAVHFDAPDDVAEVVLELAGTVAAELAMRPARLPGS